MGGNLKKTIHSNIRHTPQTFPLYRGCKIILFTRYIVCDQVFTTGDIQSSCQPDEYEVCILLSVTPQNDSSAQNKVGSFMPAVVLHTFTLRR